MKLEDSYQFHAPQEVVWEALLDPAVLQRIMPGCQKLELVGDNEYESVLKIKVGPVQGKFTGTVTLSDINEPHSYHMSIKGKGAPGHLTGEGLVRLDHHDGITTMHYSGQAKVGGRIASVGQRLMESSAKSLTLQGLKNLEKQIEARLHPEPDPAPTTNNAAAGASPPRPQVPPPSAAPPEAPSQTEFALGVAKNMLDDIIPPEKQPLVFGTLAFVGLLLLWRLLGRGRSSVVKTVEAERSCCCEC